MRSKGEKYRRGESEQRRNKEKSIKYRLDKKKK